MLVLIMEDIIVLTLWDHGGPHHGGHYCPRIIGGPWWSSPWRTLLSAHYWRTMMVLTIEDIIVHALLEDHDGPHHGGYYCPRIIGRPCSSPWKILLSAHYWRIMIVLTMEDIIVLTLLEEHDGPHHGGHYCPHIIDCSHIIKGLWWSYKEHLFSYLKIN